MKGKFNSLKKTPLDWFITPDDKIKYGKDKDEKEFTFSDLIFKQTAILFYDLKQTSQK